MQNSILLIDWLQKELPRHSDTMFSALATSANLVLAILTLLMVRSTNSMVSASRNSVELSRQMSAASLEQSNAAKTQVELSRIAMNSAIQPILLDVQHDGTVFVDQNDDWIGIFTSESKERLRVCVDFQNVGSGAALISKATAGYSLQNPCYAEDVRPIIVQPNCQTRVDFRLPPRISKENHTGRPIIVELTYTNIRGEQPTITRARLAPKNPVSGSLEFEIDRLSFKIGGGADIIAKGSRNDPAEFF